MLNLLSKKVNTIVQQCFLSHCLPLIALSSMLARRRRCRNIRCRIFKLSDWRTRRVYWIIRANNWCRLSSSIEIKVGSATCNLAQTAIIAIPAIIIIKVTMTQKTQMCAPFGALTRKEKKKMMSMAHSPWHWWQRWTRSTIIAVVSTIIKIMHYIITLII